MLQAANMGLEIPDSSPWEDRFEASFQKALTRRLNAEEQKRRERLESLLEARDAGGESGTVDVATLDSDVTQSDLEALLSSDPRAQKHFGGDATTFHVEVERILPKRGDHTFEDFRNYLDKELTPEVRALLSESELPDESRMQYFKFLDETLARKKKEEQAALRLKQQQAAQLRGKDDAVAPAGEPGVVGAGKKKAAAQDKGKKGGTSSGKKSTAAANKQKKK